MGICCGFRAVAAMGKYPRFVLFTPVHTLFHIIYSILISQFTVHLHQPILYSIVYYTFTTTPYYFTYSSYYTLNPNHTYIMFPRTLYSTPCTIPNSTTHFHPLHTLFYTRLYIYYTLFHTPPHVLLQSMPHFPFPYKSTPTTHPIPYSTTHFNPIHTPFNSPLHILTWSISPSILRLLVYFPPHVILQSNTDLTAYKTLLHTQVHTLSYISLHISIQSIQ